MANQMMKYLCLGVMGMNILLAGSAWASDSCSSTTDPSGFWLTKGGKSIIQVWAVTDKTGKVTSYSGKVYKILAVGKQKSSDRCTECKGDLANKPIVGMTILYGMTADPDTPNKWINGYAFDPSNAKTYDANMALSSDGKTLGLHGYIGMPLFGRTENWTCMTATAAAAATPAPMA